MLVLLMIVAGGHGPAAALLYLLEDGLGYDTRNSTLRSLPLPISAV